MDFNFSSINLWCNKNLVDLEFILWSVLWNNSEYTANYFEDPFDPLCEFVIVNTCWFISTSREEAESVLSDLDKNWKKLIVTGCYLQVADPKFLTSLTNLHHVIPFSDYWKDESQISSLQKKSDTLKDTLKEGRLDNYLSNIKNNQIINKAYIWNTKNTRAYINAPFGYEYIKIAEWCDNKCTFCIIPKIRWAQKSRQIEDILEEVWAMVNNWIKEIILIAQDTTRYWVDIFWKSLLGGLIDELEKSDLDFKFRLLYLYPDNMTLELLDKLASSRKFIPYFDIPFQHSSEKILKLMWRYYDSAWISSFLKHIKKNFKEYHVRTSFIVWFPQETDDDFNDLCDFVRKEEFDSVALFEYHDEPLATSSKLSGKVSEEVSRERIEILDSILNEIYTKKYKASKWKIFNWVIEDISWKKISVRRAIRAPEIDELDVIKKSDVLSWNIDIWEEITFKL